MYYDVMRPLISTAVTTLLLMVAAPTDADILIVTEQGNTPIPQQETQISMDAEKIHLRSGEGGHYKAACTFTMRSHARVPLTRTMAFPVIDPRYSRFMKQHFKVALSSGKGGKLAPVPVKLKMKRDKATWAEMFYAKPPHKSLDYPGYLVWEVSWQPGETKTIRVTYDMGGARRIGGGLVDGWSLLYVVRTGALWKGPIGKAEITIDFGRDERSHRTSATPLVISHPKNSRWLSKRKLRFSFSNWEPKRDIEVKHLGWLGLSKQVQERYFFALPHPYQGAKLRYTRAQLNRLVEGELKPWRKPFPRRVARIDRRALRKIIAAWLYHEILARHGDPFLLGKVKPDGSRPKGTVMSSEGYAYSKWNSRFSAYMYHGGWYRPRYGPKGTVKVEDLAPLERQNLAFLKQQM
jgi:hypothetical protein